MQLDLKEETLPEDLIQQVLQPLETPPTHLDVVEVEKERTIMTPNPSIPIVDLDQDLTLIQDTLTTTTTRRDNILHIEVTLTMAVDTTITTTKIDLEVDLRIISTIIKIDLVVNQETEVPLPTKITCGIALGAIGETKVSTMPVVKILVLTDGTIHQSQLIPMTLNIEIGIVLNAMPLTCTTNTIALNAIHPNENLQMVLHSPKIPRSLLFILSWVDPMLLIQS